MQRQATLCVPKVALHSPHSILHTSRFTLHFISFHLISSKLISSLRKCHLSFSQFPSSHLSNAQALSVYTQKLWHTARFYTQQTFTHKSFYWVSFYMWTPLHHRETFRHIIFYTQVFTHSKRLQTAHFYTQKPLHKDFFTHRSFYAQWHQKLQFQNRISSPKPKEDQNWEKSADKSAIPVRFTMPSCKTQLYITRTAAAARNLDATTLRSAAPSGKPNVCLRTCGNRTWQHSCSHCTAICHRRVQKLRANEQLHGAKHP